MTRIGLVAAVLVVPALLAACGPGADETADVGKPVVYTTFYPTTYFTERIGGDLVSVVCPLPADEDPIFWEPDEKTVAKYQLADLIVVNGAEFEKWVGMSSLPESITVDSARRLEDDLIVFEHAITHSHGTAGAHEHKGIDGHTWLDPENAKIQAEAILEGLKALLPDHEAELQARYDALAADLDGLGAELTRLTKAYHDQPILASHPAYNYLARRYGWTVVNLALDPETMPDEETFTNIAAIVGEHPARYILWESEPTKEIAAAMKERFGLTSVVFSPCEREGDEDYLATMKANVKRLEPVLTGS